MKIRPLLPALLTLALTLGLLQAEPFEKATVTRVVNEVSLLRPDRPARSAIVGDDVFGRTAVKTGSNSRTELQFPDQTVTRIGANALFRFQSGTRSIDLEHGTLLFASPKKVGGGQVQAGAVTAAVKGTTFLLSFKLDGEVKVIVLEGKVLVFLTKFPAIRRLIRSGQMVVVPDGAEKIPKPKRVELKTLLETSRLLESGGFGPLFNLELLQRKAKGQFKGLFGLPTNFFTTQQTSQTIRNTTRPGAGPGGPAPTPPPTPAPTPPPKPKPNPQPTPIDGINDYR